MGQTITSPNYGLVFDKPPINISSRALRDGLNFRCKNGTLESVNLGWRKFASWTLDGPVQLIDNFFTRETGESLIFGTARDIYLYNENTKTVSYLTPIYSTGTVSRTGNTVTGVGTTWTGGAVVPGDMISFGNNNQTDPTATWHEITVVGGATTLTTATSGTVAAGTSYTIRHRFTTQVDGWSVDTFVNDGSSGDDLWFATNGIDPVVTWNGLTDQLVPHPELGFRAKTIATYSNMMIYANLLYNGDSLPTTIINSDIGLPLNAGDTGTGISEQFVAHSGTDEILNLIPIGDYLVIYSERTLVPIQFVGDPLIFLFRVAISGVGPISGNAIADFGDFHEFLGSDAGYVFDGVTLKEINSHVWRDVLRQADPARRRQAYGHFDEEQGDLIWSIPSTLDTGVGTSGAPPEIAWPEHYLEDAGEGAPGTPFSKRQWPFMATGFYQQANGLTWAEVTSNWEEYPFAWNDQAFQAAFPLNLVGDHNGQIWIVNQNQTADGAPLASFVRTSRFALRSGRERDTLTRVYPFARTMPYNLDVGLYMGDFVGQEPNARGTKQFDMNMLPGQNPYVVFYRRGRTCEFTFGSESGQPWVIDGWTFDTANGGVR